MASFLQNAVARFLTNRTSNKTFETGWINAGPHQRAITLSWCMAKLLDLLGNGSFQKTGRTLHLTNTNTEYVHGVMKALITKWLDNSGYENSSMKIGPTLTEFSNSLLIRLQREKDEDFYDLMKSLAGNVEPKKI